MELQPEEIHRRIYVVRGLRVMLDADIAQLYGVSTKQLNQQVRRNARRFPIDFMFTLTPDEFNFFRPATATSKAGAGGRTKLPMVFTQEGVATLSAVLRSDRAIEVHTAIMRAFVKLREMLFQNKEFARKLADLELKAQVHDVKIKNIMDLIQEWLNPSREAPRKIGFQP